MLGPSPTPAHGSARLASLVSGRRGVPREALAGLRPPLRERPSFCQSGEEQSPRADSKWPVVGRGHRQGMPARYNAAHCGQPPPGAPAALAKSQSCGEQGRTRSPEPGVPGRQGDTCRASGNRWRPQGLGQPQAACSGEAGNTGSQGLALCPLPPHPLSFLPDSFLPGFLRPRGRRTH